MALYWSSCDFPEHPVITQTHQEVHLVQSATVNALPFLKSVLRNGQSYTFPSQAAAALSFTALYNYMLQLMSFNRITWDVMHINQCPGKPQGLTDLKNRTAGKYHPNNHHHHRPASIAPTQSLTQWVVGVGGVGGGVVGFLKELQPNAMFAQMDAMIGCLLFESSDWRPVPHLTFMAQWIIRFYNWLAEEKHV